MTRRARLAPFVLAALPVSGGAGCLCRSSGPPPSAVASASAAPSYGPFVDLQVARPPPPTAPAAKASLAARPGWAAAGDDYAPPCPDERALFDGAAAPAEPVTPALLACRASYAKNTDATPFAESPDLTLRVSLAGRAELEVRGPEDRKEAYFTVPLVELSAGEGIAVRLLDRDEPLTGLRASHDDLGVVAFPWGKLPLVASEGDAKVECRLVGDAAARAQEAKAAREAKDAIAKVEKLPHLLEPGAGGLDGLDAPHGPLSTLACSRGWAHAEVRALVGAHDAALGARRARGRALLEARAGAAGGPLRLPGFEVRRATWACPTLAPDAPAGCRVVLELSVQAARLALPSLAADGTPGVDLAVVDAQGVEHRLSFAEARSGAEKEGQGLVARRGAALVLAFSAATPLPPRPVGVAALLARTSAASAILPWDSARPAGRYALLRLD